MKSDNLLTPHFFERWYFPFTRSYWCPKTVVGIDEPTPTIGDSNVPIEDISESTKKVKSQDSSRYMTTIIKDVALQEKQRCFAKDLSGGMKRKLSGKEKRNEVVVYTFEFYNFTNRMLACYVIPFPTFTPVAIAFCGDSKVIFLDVSLFNCL